MLLFRKFRNGYELLNFRKANYSNESCGISWGNQFGYTSRGCLIKFHNFRKIRLFHSSLKIPEIFTRIFLRRFVSLFQKSHANVGILMTVECRAASPQKGRNFDDVKKKKNHCWIEDLRKFCSNFVASSSENSIFTSISRRNSSKLALISLTQHWAFGTSKVEPWTISHYVRY